jgi:hypothetical protein
MMIDDLVKRLTSMDGCAVYPAQGQPTTSSQLPDDLRRFYTLCGGACLFEKSLFPLLISPPSEFVPSNEVVLGGLSGGDPSDNWYVVAKSGAEQLISIDLNPDRMGRCYDSFWDRHGIVGSCPIIALSFTDFLAQSLEARGVRPYWLSGDFVSMGDAYD